MNAAIQAQTLTDPDNVPLIGTVVDYHVAPYALPGSAGAGVSWDFSTLTTDSFMTYQAVDPASSQWATMFPDAELAIANGTDTIFYNVTASGMERVGEDMTFVTFDVQVPFSDPQLDLKMPCSMGTAWTDIIGATFDISGIGTATRSGTLTGNADATGTLSMPYGSLLNTIRVHTRLDETDVTAFATATHKRDEWVWYTTFQKFPILRILSDTIAIPPPLSVTQIIRRTEWLDAASVGLLEYSSSATFNVWPNPTSEAVNIESAPAQYDRDLVITDMTGRAVMHGAIRAGDADLRFDLSDLVPGAYSITIGSLVGGRSSSPLLIAR